MLAASRPENLVMGKRNLSTDPGRLNEDNMVQYHDPHHTAGTTALKQEWDTSFKGIPVLKIADEQEAILADGVDCTAQLYPHASSRQKHVYGETPRVSLLMELTDRVGILHDVLKYFWKFDVNVCRIESRPVQSGRWGGKPKFDFYVDLDGSLEQENVQKLLDELGPMTEKLIVLDERDVHWFPVSRTSVSLCLFWLSDEPHLSRERINLNSSTMLCAHFESIYHHRDIFLSSI